MSESTPTTPPTGPDSSADTPPDTPPPADSSSAAAASSTATDSADFEDDSGIGHTDPAVFGAISTADTTRINPAHNRPDFAQGSLLWHTVRFGAPLVVAMLFMAAFNLIDIFIVGRLRDAHAAVTIVSICDALLTLFVVLVTGIGNASIAYIARAVGNHDFRAARDASTQAILIVGAVSVLVMLLGIFFPAQILRLLGISPQATVFTLGVDYLRVALVGGFTMFFVVQFTSTLRGVGNSTWPTIILVVVNVLNIVLAIVLVLGPDDNVSFGLGWGVIGAAWAALFARIVGFAMCLYVFVFGVGRHYFVRNIFHWRPNWKLIRSMLFIGLPSSAQLIVRVGSMLGLISILFHFLTTDYDTTVGTAFALCSKLDLVALFMALGWGQAASTIVGQMLGAGHDKRAEHVGWIATWLSCGTLAVVGVVFFAGAPYIVGFFFEKDTEAPNAIATGAAEPIAARAAAEFAAVDAKGSGLAENHQLKEALAVYWHFYTAEENQGTPAAGRAWLAYKHIEHQAVVKHGMWYVRIMVFAWIVMGVGIVISQAMTGAGSTRIPAVLDTVALLVILLPAVALLLALSPLRERAVWVTITLAHMILAVLYMWTFRKGLWKHNQI